MGVSSWCRREMGLSIVLLAILALAHALPGNSQKDLDKDLWALVLGESPSSGTHQVVTAQPADIFTAVLETDISETPIVIEVTRSLAPLGADRFHALVKDGFYQDSALFRVVPNFVLQFGISGNPENNKKWLHNSILDDPVLGSNTRGTICFATDGPNTRTSQVFINFANNSRLDTNNFAPFGK